MPRKAKVTHKNRLVSPRSKVTPELYERILLWYVRNGLQHMKATKVFGLGRRTLTGLYYEGCPALKQPPMRLLVDNVEVRARALRQQLKEEELEKAEAEIQDIIQGTATKSTLAAAADDSVRARAEEGAVVSAARRNILQLQSMLAPLLKGAVTRLAELERDIKELAPDDLIKLMRELARFQTDLVNAGKVNMDMERMLLGSGTTTNENTTTLDQKDAMRVLGLASKTLSRFKKEGRVIDATGEEVQVTTNPLLSLDEDDDDDEDDDAAIELGPIESGDAP